MNFAFFCIVGLFPLASPRDIGTQTWTMILLAFRALDYSTNPASRSRTADGNAPGSLNSILIALVGLCWFTLFPGSPLNTTNARIVFPTHHYKGHGKVPKYPSPPSSNDPVPAMASAMTP